METVLSAADVERLAGAAGISVDQLCARAGIARSTFSRWKAGTTEPNLGVYRRILSVLRDAGTDVSRVA